MKHIPHLTNTLMEYPFISLPEQEVTWPPPYQLRKSKRAKRLQLQVTPQKGLEIVVPYRFGKFNVISFLEEHKPWIISQLLKIPKKTLQAELPTNITLPAINEQWQVRYLSEQEGGLRIKVNNPNKELLIQGEEQLFLPVQQKLKKWISTYAKQSLLSWLAYLSQETGLLYQKGSIRTQRTRWGSCSATGDISLNSQLLFLPPNLAQHIILHELCHTRYLNHSKQFWALLGKLDPYCQQHKQAFKKAESYIPAWFTAKERLRTEQPKQEENAIMT